MEDWSDRLECVECNIELEIPFGANEVSCHKCIKKYEIKINSISYAVCETGSITHYRYTGDGIIEAREFNNPPFLNLEEAVQDNRHINKAELRPYVLCGIVSKYHDAIKNRLKRLLTGEISRVREKDKKDIMSDYYKGRSINIVSIFDCLLDAFPSKRLLIENFLLNNTHILKRIRWIRDKEVHYLPHEWKLNSKIFEERKYHPDSPEKAEDNLNYEFTRKANTVAIEIFLLASHLENDSPEEWKISTIESFRLFSC